MYTYTWECAVISRTAPETCKIFLNSQLTEKPLLRDFKNSEFQTEGVSINKLPIVRQVRMLNERKSGLPKLLVLVQWNSMFLSGKIQKLICKQNTPTYGKRWQASWNYSTKWANSKGLTWTLECLQSLSSMGEASSLLWVASGGSDGPFGHQRWSPQAAAVNTERVGTRHWSERMQSLLYHLPEASFWPSLSITFLFAEGTYDLPTEELWDRR